MKKASKYVLNILTIVNALLLGINSVEGIVIPYIVQITGVIAAINGVISTYLLGSKATYNTRVSYEELSNGKGDDE